MTPSEALWDLVEASQNFLDDEPGSYGLLECALDTARKVLVGSTRQCSSFSAKGFRCDKPTGHSHAHEAISGTEATCWSDDK